MSIVLDLRVHSPSLWEDTSVTENDLIQPVAANMPIIETPGVWGYPQYSFDGAAAPNSDHFYTTDVAGLKTQQGTLLVWFSPDDFTAQQTLLCLCEDGANGDEYRIDPVFNIANDPLDITFRLNGANSWIGRLPVSLFNTELNFLALTSDGSTVRAYVNGVAQTITDTVGANSGQWFGDTTDADVFVVGCIRRAALTIPYNGKISKLVIRDDCLSPLEIQQTYQRQWWRVYGI